MKGSSHRAADLQTYDDLIEYDALLCSKLLNSRLHKVAKSAYL